jgi:hypothetical protein
LRENNKLVTRCIANPVKLRLQSQSLKGEQAMHAGILLQKRLIKSCGIHKKRLEVLIVAAQTVVKTNRLSVTGLGRGIVNKTKTKHNINRMDRLIGNEYLYKDAKILYQATAEIIMKIKGRTLIIVDWSSATAAERYQLLRAAVPVGGRTLTLYEEVQELEKYNNPKVHKEFLKNLHQILPANCRPIIVTDAGFGIPWFKQVLSYGWDYVGRIINNSYYTQDKENWISIHSLLSYPRSQIKRLGKVLLSKQHEFTCYLLAYKSRKKGRVRKNVYGEKAARSVSVQSAKRGRQAWVLASSLGDSELIAKRIVEIYQTRMQIEESFRDIKNPQFGFGLRYSRSLGKKRLTNLFIIGLLGTLIAWLTGLCAKNNNLHYSFQTNSLKNCNVLSVFFIGCQVIRHAKLFTKKELMNAIYQVREVTSFAF